MRPFRFDHLPKSGRPVRDRPRPERVRRRRRAGTIQFAVEPFAGGWLNQQPVCSQQPFDLHGNPLALFDYRKFRDIIN